MRALRPIVLLLVMGGLTVLVVHGQSFTKIVLTDDTGWSEGGNWIDYDGDGDLDLFIPNNRRSPNRNFLYENNGDGTFTKVETGVLVTDIVMSESGTWGDYDNDGDIDLFVADGGFDQPRFNSLYRNNADGSFTEVTNTIVAQELSFSTSSSWADIDNDGDLDLFAATLSPANNANINGVDFLYENNGDGTFSKITTGPLVTTPTRSFGVAWADYDLDGDVDLFVANSSCSNLLSRNEGGGSFTRMTAAQVGQLVAEGGSIAVSWGDYNNDGYPDVFVTNFQRNDYLYRNDGDGTFTKITTGPVVTSGGVGEGSAWADYDNDGDLDLFVANGGPMEDINFLFRNQLIETGAASFARVTSNEAGEIAADPGCFAGAVWGDYDNDGDVDLFASNFNGKNSFIYRNETQGNHWINIRARGTLSNRSALGARIGIKARLAMLSTWQWRQVAGQTGYNGQNSLRAHFGLLNATVIDSLVIHWPSGMVDTFTDLAADQFLVATEGQTVSPVATEDQTPLPEQVFLGPNYPNPFIPETHIGFVLPEARFVTLKVYDVLGREVTTLVEGRRTAGPHEATFDGRGLPSGLYVYVLETDGVRRARQMLLIK